MRLTLVIMKLARGMAIQFVQELDDVRICIGAAERVSRAVKAQNELLGLKERFRWRVSHPVRTAVCVTHGRQEIYGKEGEEGLGRGDSLKHSPSVQP